MRLRKRDFTLRQLSSFVTAARAGSFALAAEQLGISQPAISDHIAALEQHLGHALFERRRGTTPKLTPEGVEMLHRAESLLRTSEAMRGSRPRMGTDGRVRIRVSVGPRTREVYLKPLLPRLYADHPHIEIELVPVLPLNEVPAALEKNEIDLLVYTVGAVPHGIANVNLIADVPVDIVASPEIVARVGNGSLRIEDVPFILPCNSLIYDNWLERQLVAAGIHTNKPIRYVEFADILQSMIETGGGASVLMREQVEDALVAGRLATLGPGLEPMKRILIRASGAPRGTEMLERELIRALRPTTPAPAVRNALELLA